MKLSELIKISDPEAVALKAQEFRLNPVYESSRQDKKYMVFDGNKMVHFGSKMEDWTKHRDPDRRRKFRKRNWQWQFAPRYTPAWLSWTLLW